MKNRNLSILKAFIFVMMAVCFFSNGTLKASAARNVLELAGYKNIRTKSLGSNNKQNVVLATIKGLSEIKTPEEIARLRGKSVDEILN